MLRHYGSRLAVGLALAGGATIAALLPVLPAVGDHSPVEGESPAPPVVEVEVGRSATLGARGAVVFVRVRVACSEHADAFIDVQVTQRVGRVVTVGRGFTSDVQCDGEIHGYRVPATPESGSRAFRRGAAFAQARAFATFPPPNGMSTEAQDSREITIERAGRDATVIAA
jgi:hypothetical protein